MEMNINFKIEKPIGLVYNWNKVKSIDSSNCTEQSSTTIQLMDSDNRFSLSDDLKFFFQNEIKAKYVAEDESDLSIARYFINEMNNDDPFYIVDVSHCVKQYMKWNYYLPRVKCYYAVKTNSNHFLIQVIGKLNCGFDCASIEELNSVLSVYPELNCSKQIIYSHPCKPISHINYFRNRNVELTVIDNIDEMIKIKEFWSNAKILIRLKTNDSSSLIPLSTKFGANKRIIIDLLNKAKELKLNIIGCAFHVGTGCYDGNIFRQSLEFAKWFFDIIKQFQYQIEMKILDIGGGFPGVDEENKPTFSDIATIINQTLEEFFPENENIEIIAEPGRFYAAASMNLVTSIIGVRSNNKSYNDNLSLNLNNNYSSENADRFYYINDGIFGSFANILYEKAIYYLNCLRKDSKKRIKSEEKLFNSAVFGPTCDSSDCLSPFVYLPLMNIGDYFYFYYVGAYSSSASTNFNGFNTNKYFYIWKN